MHFEAIQKKLKKTPFVPFDIVMSSGDRYRVNHPDNVMVTRRSLVVALAKPKRGDIPEDYADFSYLHVSALEPVVPHQRKAG
jgi:hypothetical protein